MVNLTCPQDRKGAVLKRKHMEVPQSRELKEAVYRWYVDQRSVSVNMRGLEIADVANKLARHMGIESFKASDGWLWRFRNRHGIGNKVEHFRLKFYRLMEKTTST